DGARGKGGGALREYAGRLASWDPQAVTTARDERLGALMSRHLDRSDATWAEREFDVVADPVRARFAAWYEFFPRSGVAGRHATLKDAEVMLERAASLGFDVVYLPPIHPVGRTHRKGRNNRLTAQAGDPGSVWAIGGDGGGHTEVNPELGTLADFDRFVARAHRLGPQAPASFPCPESPAPRER